MPRSLPLNVSRQVDVEILAPVEYLELMSVLELISVLSPKHYSSHVGIHSSDIL